MYSLGMTVNFDEKKKKIHVSIQWNSRNRNRNHFHSSLCMSYVCIPLSYFSTPLLPSPPLSFPFLTHRHIQFTLLNSSFIIYDSPEMTSGRANAVFPFTI